MKTKKCCYQNCPNEAVGYFVTSSSGLWLCEKHGGKAIHAKTKIEEIRDNPKFSHLHDMEIN